MLIKVFQEVIAKVALKKIIQDCETISCKTFDECFEIASNDNNIKTIIPESNKTTGNIGIEYLIFLNLD